MRVWGESLLIWFWADLRRQFSPSKSYEKTWKSTMTHKSLEKGKVIFHKSEKWDYVSARLKVIFLSSSDEKLDFKVRRKKWCKYFFRQKKSFSKWSSNKTWKGITSLICIWRVRISRKKDFFMGDWALLARHIFEIWSFNNMC